MTAPRQTPGNSLKTELLLGSKPADGNLFPWLFPTADFRNFDKFGSVALPAATTATIIGDGNIANGNSMPWNVPKGYNGFIRALGIEFVPNASANLWTPGVLPQQLGFTILVNNKPAYDYGNVAYSPGLVDAPTPIFGIPIKEGNLVEVRVTNYTITADTQFVMARLLGFYYGKQFEPKGLAF